MTSELSKINEQLAIFLLAVYEESFTREGVKTLFWLIICCAITLLNNDYKILASILPDWLKFGLENLIDKWQSGFIKG